MPSESNQPLRLDTDVPQNGPVDSQGTDEDSESFEVEASWEDQPLRLPAYTPSSAALEASHEPTTPTDDPIHLAGSKKHFGFSSRQSLASSIFPWKKHKPAVCYQYAPHRPPLSKRSSLAALKVTPVSHPDPVKHLDDQELDILYAHVVILHNKKNMPHDLSHNCFVLECSEF